MKAKEERAAYMRAYRMKHRQELIDYHRAWYARMGNEINRRQRKRRREDPAWRESELRRHQAMRLGSGMKTLAGAAR